MSVAVPRAYRTVRDHLDDIIGFTRAVFEQTKATNPARLAELQFEIVDRHEQIEGSLEIARISSMALPLDRLRKAFKLETEEVRCIYLLLGEIIEPAPTQELFLNPKHKQTEMYIAGRYG